MFDRSGTKLAAQNLIKTAKPSPIYAGLMCIALSIVVSFLSSRLNNAFTLDEMNRYMQYALEGRVEQAWSMLESHTPSVSAQLINLALQIVTDIVGVGFIIFLFNTIRRTGACFGNLLDGFGIAGRIILLYILELIFIVLWSLLLIIPGFIAAYRYRMAIYLLIDHPELSPMDCIRESKRMMAGHKAELFLLDFSFIGWELLACLPYLGYLVRIWTVPYIDMTLAMYYEWLCGRPYGFTQ